MKVLLINGSPNKERCTYTALREVADALAEDYGIATRSGAHCAPRLHRALGTEGQGAVRFSFGWYNTEEETDAAIRAVEELAR